MIPAFDDNGYLPPGIYMATLDEIAERFGGQSEERQAQMDSLRWLVQLAQAAGAKRLVVNGSFVTDVSEPRDVDCVLLMNAPIDPATEMQLTSFRTCRLNLRGKTFLITSSRGSSRPTVQTFRKG